MADGGSRAPPRMGCASRSTRRARARMRRARPASGGGFPRTCASVLQGEPQDYIAPAYESLLRINPAAGRSVAHRIGADTHHRATADHALEESVEMRRQFVEVDRADLGLDAGRFPLV